MRDSLIIIGNCIILSFSFSSPNKIINYFSIEFMYKYNNTINNYKIGTINSDDDQKERVGSSRDKSDNALI